MTKQAMQRLKQARAVINLAIESYIALHPEQARGYAFDLRGSASTLTECNIGFLKSERAQFDPALFYFIAEHLESHGFGHFVVRRHESDKFAALIVPPDSKVTFARSKAR